MGPQPGDALPVTYELSPVEGGSWQCTMKVNRRCSELLWEGGAEKCFVGEIYRSKRLAQQSAAGKFWQDADVLKKAENLPPSKRHVLRLSTSEDYKNRQHAANEAKRNARLAWKNAQNAR